MTCSPIDKSALLETLRQVIDPELDCNIVDLGLIDDIEFENGKVTVRMTLTTPGCPMHESIGWGVQSALLDQSGVDEVEVKWVWDPPWNPSRMSEYGRARVGIIDSRNSAC